MAKKLLIAGGCSYTNERYITNDKNLPKIPGAWKMWPEYLGNHLGLETINTGHSGIGNESILHRVMEKVLMYKERVDTVAVMWSGMDRRRIFSQYDLNPIAEAQIRLGLNPAHDSNDPFAWLGNLNLQDISSDFFQSKEFYKVKPSFIKYSMEDSLRAYYMLADYCAKNNIKFIFVNALVPFDYHTFILLEESGVMNYPDNIENTHPQWIMQTFVNNIYFNKFDKEYKKHFLGWPIFSDIGGGYLAHWMLNEKPSPYFDKGIDYRVSEVDGHPNEAAQIAVSKMIIEKYNKLYG